MANQDIFRIMKFEGIQTQKAIDILEAADIFPVCAIEEGQLLMADDFDTDEALKLIWASNGGQLCEFVPASYESIEAYL